MFNEFTYFLQQDPDIFILKRKVNPRNSGRHEVHVVMDVQLAAHCMLGQHPVTLPVHVHLLCMGGRADDSARTLAPPLLSSVMDSLLVSVWHLTRSSLPSLLL